MVNHVQFHTAAPTAPAGMSRPVKTVAAAKTAFSQVLESEVQRSKEVRFSNHALERLDNRGIRLSAGDCARVERAVDQLAAKGARESVVILDRLALVVNVPNRTVITAVSQDDVQDQVFTNVDSAVVLASAAA